MRRAWELVAVALRAARRAGLVWGISLVILVALTIAFYPSFRDSAGLEDLMGDIPQPLIDAFGLADFGSPAGFLRGNLYAVLVPLLLAVAGVLLMNGQTATDEDSGRMEPYLAQPVTRASLFLGRVTAVMVWLLVIGALVLATQLVTDELVGLEIATDRIVPTVVLCVLLGVLHAAVAALVAGWTGRPGLVLGVGMALAVGGYVVMALFPLSDVLEPWRNASPWAWALSGDPLVNETEPWRYLALLGPAVVLIAVGTWLFGKRDVQAG